MGLVGGLLLVALGIGLGAGPLQGDGERRAREAAQQRDALTQRDQQIADLQRQADLGAAYTSATAARALDGRLAGRTVAILTLPGSDATTVEHLEELLQAAGAEVTAKVGLSDALLDPGGEGLVEALSSQMVQQTSGLQVAAGVTGYQRIGALLARAIAVTPSERVARASYDPTAISILSGLGAAKLVDGTEVTARAGFSVVVLAPTTPPAHAAALSSILGAYGAQVPSVVAGPASSAAEGQVLAELRSQGAPLSTVDSVDTTMGRVVTVLAVAARTRGISGDYGIVGAVNAAVPPDS